MNPDIRSIIQKIDDGRLTIGVVGLGYVGLPVACKFAEYGYQVRGVDIDEGKVNILNNGVTPLKGNEPGLAELLKECVDSKKFKATCSYEEISMADVYTINVDTPIDSDRQPRYEALIAACRSLSKVMNRGSLVIVESTISPGTMESIVKPILETGTGLRVNEGFFLGHCPERVMPGKLLDNLVTLSRVCGGFSEETSNTMVCLYKNIVNAELHHSDCKTAELVKTVENAYRDVNIAFANEVANICEKVGANVWDVRELVNTSPGRNMLLPGSGVGGHCIPKDPWLLLAGLDEKFSNGLIATARLVNDSMPIFVGEAILAFIQNLSLLPSEAKITLLGYTYLEDCDDIRNSPTETLVRFLNSHNIFPSIHDPYLEEYSEDLDVKLKSADILVIMVAHSQYKCLDSSSLMDKDTQRELVIYDTRNALLKKNLSDPNISYKLLGKSTDSEE